MALPSSEAELRAFILTVMEKPNPADAPEPPPGIGVVQELITRAEEAFEIITQREQAMSKQEQETKEAFDQMAVLVGAFDARLVEMLATVEENNDRTVAELLKQDEATEAQIASAQQQLARDQVRAHQQAGSESANQLVQQQATV